MMFLRYNVNKKAAISSCLVYFQKMKMDSVSWRSLRRAGW